MRFRTDPDRSLLSSKALIRSPDGRLLLVKPVYEATWDLPGGLTRDVEAPTEACQRETFEETGLRVEVGRLLVTDWAPKPAEGAKLFFIFDCGILTSNNVTSQPVDTAEISDLDLFSNAEAYEALSKRVALRLAAAIICLNRNDQIYLQNGLDPWSISLE